MALDDQVRKNADALAKELGLDIQQAFARFLDDVLGQVTREHDTLQAQADQAVQAVAEADARAEAAQAAVTAAQAEADAQKTQALATAKDESAAAIQAAITQTREHVAREAASLVARAREEAAQANAALAADRESRRAVDEEAAALRAAAEQGSLAAMERLLDAFRRLDQATTLTALIDTLAEAAAGETTRSAVFVVRGREVRGWRVTGFSDGPADVRMVTMPLDAAGPIGVCVRSKGRVDITPATFADAGELAFMTAADAASGLAMPVTLGGETAAVIYGDEGGAGGPAGWRETIEILARHASRCLEAQTAIRAAKLGPGARQEPVGAER
jgi:multidrug efflux pump subunit AcrA (membrane-fusion protein)